MVEIKDLSPEEAELLAKKYAGGRYGPSPTFVRVGSKNWILPEAYEFYSEKYSNFSTRPSDVFITGYPTSGDTLTGDICWFLTHNLDFERAKNLGINDRARLLELDTLYHYEKPKDATDFLDTIVQDEEQRCIKTHLAFELLPQDLLDSGVKVIYVARNVKDEAIARYNIHTTKNLANFQGTFEEYWSLFKQNLLLYTPYFEHLKQGLEQQNNKNVLVILHEDLKEDLRGNIQKISEFLETNITDDQLNELTNFLGGEEYQKIVNNPKFLRENVKLLTDEETGIWKDHYSDELNAEVDEWIAENLAQINVKLIDVLYTPYFEHLKQGLEQQNNKNVLVILHEDLKEDLRGNIQKISEFLETNITDDQLNELTNFLGGEEYQKIVNNPKFLRENVKLLTDEETGIWKDHYSDELNAEVDEWIAENLAQINVKLIDGVKYSF